MKTYELTFILNPNLDKELVNAEIEKITSQIEAGNGKILEVQHLGMKKMTFEMNGFRQGNYYTIYHQSDPPILQQLDAKMKLNENILRSLTIVLKPSEYVPSVKEEKKAVEPEINDEITEEDANDDLNEEEQD